MNRVLLPSLYVTSSRNAVELGVQPTIIAIPACDEEERLGRCLAALALQRDERGQRLPSGSYRVLLYANNCRDRTAEAARQAGRGSTIPIDVVEGSSVRELAAAGFARRTAMNLAADRFALEGTATGLILTTDADSVVAPTWIANMWSHFARGADCVAGYVDADPYEFVGLGSDFQRRGLLEDQYHAIVAEIFSLLDPRPHDPWPNHQVSSGANLGITLDMYRAIGGLPLQPAGEDAALTLAVECAGGKVRHAMNVCVSTSCRLEGRAAGGAAEAMRLRHAVTDTPCDEELESAFAVTRKAWLKGHLRKASNIGFMEESAILGSLGLSAEQLASLLITLRETCFEVFWQEVCNLGGALQQAPLRPSMLPDEIARGEMLLRFLRAQPDPLEAIDLFMENGVIFEARLHSLNE